MSARTLAVLRPRVNRQISGSRENRGRGREKGGGMVRGTSMNERIGNCQLSDLLFNMSVKLQTTVIIKEGRRIQKFALGQGSPIHHSQATSNSLPVSERLAEGSNVNVHNIF